jgi:CHAT domain-containing protein
LHDGRNYLIDDYSFVYLTSGRDLLTRPLAVAASPPLILANPAFGPVSGDASLSHAQVTDDLFAALGAVGPLPGTAVEARRVRELLPGARLLEGARATEESLRVVRSPRVLHLATHGVFLEVAVDRVAPPAATRQRGLVPVELTEPLLTPLTPVENPLNRSALLLAGVGDARRRQDRARDGLLTAQEVMGLDLRGTQLVVLSACDSGRGGLRTGQGVYGLRRAFLVAGTETLVASLWQVADRETAELMAGYYQNLQRGQGRAEAMRSAALWIRTQPGKQHPAYWAPFIVLGSDKPLAAVRSRP